MKNEQLIMPQHVGIIMDGNRRWATSRGLKSVKGHQAGAKNLKKLCIHANKVGLKYLSIYAFSTENFKRAKEEVDFLMDLFITGFKKEFKNVDDIKIIFSGKREPLPDNVWEAMQEITENTKNNTGLVLNVCLNYGGHSEIVDMTKKVCQLYKNNEITLDDITETLVQKNLYQDLPLLDLVIRTSGEMRLSNFMLYQASYAEFYFSNVYFPDFDVDKFDEAILNFNHRNRRFGGNL